MERTEGIPYIAHGFKEDTNFECVPVFFLLFLLK